MTWYIPSNSNNSRTRILGNSLLVLLINSFTLLCQPACPQRTPQSTPRTPRSPPSSPPRTPPPRKARPPPPARPSPSSRSVQRRLKKQRRRQSAQPGKRRKGRSGRRGSPRTRQSRTMASCPCTRARRGMVRRLLAAVTRPNTLRRPETPQVPRAQQGHRRPKGRLPS